MCGLFHYNLDSSGSAPGICTLINPPPTLQAGFCSTKTVVMWGPAGTLALCIESLQSGENLLKLWTRFSNKASLVVSLAKEFQ